MKDRTPTSVIILAGGYGTRIAEKTNDVPKPMIFIGDKPIIWHVMKIYAKYGFENFIICCGYKGYLIKDYFINYAKRNSDISISLNTGEIELHQTKSEPWNVTLLDTGLDTMTGGRLKRALEWTNDKSVCCTYADGLSNINIHELVKFHREGKQLVSITAVQPPGRFGSIIWGDDHKTVHKFQEKPSGDGAWINGGFFIIQRDILDFLKSDDTIWEKEPLSDLSALGKVSAYKHYEFWHPMDTLRDYKSLNTMWNNGNCPWLQNETLNKI